MGVFTKILDKEREFIEEQYQIKILDIKNISNGILNSNFQIDCENIKYILRVFEADREYYLYRERSFYSPQKSRNLAIPLSRQSDSYEEKPPEWLVKSLYIADNSLHKRSQKGRLFLLDRMEYLR